MSTKIDTGHVPNVANFKELIQRVSAIPTYNPARVALKISQLETLHAQAEIALDATSTAFAFWKDKIKERSDSFDQMTALAVRVVAFMKSSEIRLETINDAKSILRKIRGARAKAVVPSSTDTPATDPAEDDITVRSVSASQRSFDQQAKNFDALIKLAKTQIEYTPNEFELTIISLEDFLANLQQLNKDASAYSTGVFTQRFQRNTLLYAPKTGLYNVAMAVKDYVKSHLGTQDARYTELRKLKFTSLRG